MILGFHQYFDPKKTQPTYFREKIQCGVPNVGLYPQVSSVVAKQMFKPKTHTLREDKHDRWKAGMSIQMVYRGPNYSIEDHFNKGITELEMCKSTQKVDIKWYKDTSDISQVAAMIGIKQKDVKISFDGKECIHVSFNDGGISCAGVSYDRIVHGDFFQNDGFRDVYEFFNWFNKDFTGKVIHWTDLRY